MGRYVYVVPDGTEITAELVEAAEAAGASEIAVGVPPALAEAAAEISIPGVVEDPTAAEPDPDVEPDIEPAPDVEPDTSAEDALIAAAGAASTIAQLREAVVAYAEAVKTGKA